MLMPMREGDFGSRAFNGNLRYASARLATFSSLVNVGMIGQADAFARWLLFAALTSTSWKPVRTPIIVEALTPVGLRSLWRAATGQRSRGVAHPNLRLDSFVASCVGSPI